MNPRKDQTPCLAFLGTGSDVGKSVLATAMCRVLSDRGVKTAPFKAQNMSNNSGVTPEGLEMGRAQIVQAEACRLPPHVDMNPVLLKPTGESGSQVVVLGEALGTQSAKTYYASRAGLFETAAKALDRLRGAYEAIVMEGAGSCAEVNLMAHDFVNLSMAAHASAPVILVADIHKGGVFAQIVGTLECLAPEQRGQIAGFIINRFRGDRSLFADGVKWLEAKTQKPCFGVIPWFEHIRIEAEDSVVIERPATVPGGSVRSPAVAVLRLPHISNFTDFDPLAAVEGLNLYFLEVVQDLKEFSALVLPGSKNSRADMHWLHKSGWAGRIRAFRDAGGHLLGICGGYQMLGEKVSDPEGLEGDPGEIQGLGMLPVQTRLAAPKTTSRARFLWEGAAATGYEIHMGRTRRHGGSDCFRVVEENGRPVDIADGCVSKDGRVMGTYMHGLFDTPGILEKWLARIGLEGLEVGQAHGLAARDVQYDRLARHFASHADTRALMKLMGVGCLKEAL